MSRLASGERGVASGVVGSCRDTPSPWRKQVRTLYPSWILGPVEVNFVLDVSHGLVTVLETLKNVLGPVNDEYEKVSLLTSNMDSPT